MSEIQFVKFDRETVDDFRSLILPDVTDQLLQCDDFDDMALVCAGALDDETPVGAVVAQFLEHHEVYIYSIYVDPDYRNRHIGNELMDRVVTEALDAYESQNLFEDTPVQLFLHTEYVLPAEDGDCLKAFLQSYGFGDFLDKEPAYLFSDDDLKKNTVLGNAFTAGFVPSADVCSLSAILGESADAATDYLNACGSDTDTDYIFVYQKENEITASIAALYGGENEFSLVFTQNAEIAADIYTEMLRGLLNAFSRDFSDFNVAVSTDRSGGAEFWKGIAQNCGETFIRSEAGMYLSLE